MRVVHSEFLGVKRYFLCTMNCHESNHRSRSSSCAERAQPPYANVEKWNAAQITTTSHVKTPTYNDGLIQGTKVLQVARNFDQLSQRIEKNLQHSYVASYNSFDTGFQSPVKYSTIGNNLREYLIDALDERRYDQWLEDSGW